MEKRIVSGNRRTDLDRRAIDVANMGLGAAIIAICSWISIPTAVPFTLQTFAVFFILSLFGGRKGTITIAVYILIGLAGLPVFSGFKGGPAVLLGPTGGYIVGFLITGILFILITKIFGESHKVVAISLLLGLAACYTFGTIWFIKLYSAENGAISAFTALSWCVFPFVIPDIIKLVLAMGLSDRIKKVMVGGKTVHSEDER